jgi:hypothetical protein
VSLQGKKTEIFFSFILWWLFSVLFPLLKPDNVCDEIVEAIRKDEHMLLIPKVLKLGLFIKRFDKKETVTFCS